MHVLLFVVLIVLMCLCSFGMGFAIAELLKIHKCMKLLSECEKRLDERGPILERLSKAGDTPTEAEVGMLFQVTKAQSFDQGVMHSIELLLDSKNATV